jgi:hypothetical protein
MVGVRSTYLGPHTLSANCEHDDGEQAHTYRYEQPQGHEHSKRIEHAYSDEGEHDEYSESSHEVITSFQ